VRRGEKAFKNKNGSYKYSALFLLAAGFAIQVILMKFVCIYVKNKGGKLVRGGFLIFKPHARAFKNDIKDMENIYTQTQTSIQTGTHVDNYSHTHSLILMEFL